LGSAGQAGSTWKIGAWRACAVARVNADGASTSAMLRDATNADASFLRVICVLQSSDAVPGDTAPLGCGPLGAPRHITPRSRKQPYDIAEERDSRTWPPGRTQARLHGPSRLAVEADFLRLSGRYSAESVPDPHGTDVAVHLLSACRAIPPTIAHLCLRTAPMPSNGRQRALNDLVKGNAAPLTTSELADMVGFSATFIRSEIRGGHLRAIALGRGRKRVYRILPQDAVRYARRLGLL
jgi:hypothetical protein